jgi:hypothetical protein
MGLSTILTDMDNNKLTINNFDKLKGKAIGLYEIEQTTTTEDAYQIRGVKPIVFTNNYDAILITVNRNGHSDAMGTYWVHRMVRLVIGIHGDKFIEAKEVHIPIEYIKGMRNWLNWMGEHESSTVGWKGETLDG